MRAYDKQNQQIQQYEWFLLQRCRITQILGARGNAEVVPFLRQAFQICWQIEQQPAPFHDGTWDVLRNEWWHAYEDYLAYALGQLGAWEALTDLRLPEDHLSMAIFHQALGALGFTDQKIFSLRDGSPLAPFDVNPASIARILEEHFGFSKDEQRRYIAQFRLVYQARKNEGLTKKDDHVQREKDALERWDVGQSLARKYFRQELFPVGSDFEAALALFNQHCHEIHVEPVRQQDCETNLRTDARGALGSFLVMINRLAGWQGPTYANIDGKTSVLRAPTPAWEAAHPDWREEKTAYHCGRRIQVSRKYDGYYARVLCPELDYTHGPVSSLCNLTDGKPGDWVNS